MYDVVVAAAAAAVVTVANQSDIKSLHFSGNMSHF
jgi:hypothetical protein